MLRLGALSMRRAAGSGRAFGSVWWLGVDEPNQGIADLLPLRHCLADRMCCSNRLRHGALSMRPLYALASGGGVPASFWPDRAGSSTWPLASGTGWWLSPSGPRRSTWTMAARRRSLTKCGGFLPVPRSTMAHLLECSVKLFDKYFHTEGVDLTSMFY